MLIPESIRRHLPKEAYAVDDIGCSSAKVLLFPDRVLKIERNCNASANECHMMRWLHGRLPVPEIIAAEQVEETRYLLMSRIHGEYLCTGGLLDDQLLLAELVAQGLQKLWAVEVADCPTCRSLNTKFGEIEEGLRGGWLTREQAAQPEPYGSGDFTTPAQLFDWLVKHRPQEELVLSHGDCCLPNLFAENGRLTGFIDLGQSGAADKWVDIEKVLWSMWANTTGKFGGKQRPFDRKLLFDALSMDPDEDKLRYYALLGELC